ncbi:MAG TPA: hypothetical protein VHC20_02215 [Candidatus Paceibacterota bacterium]|nr:hypothetical protein [Candidatus Paceibacterota bacterium]
MADQLRVDYRSTFEDMCALIALGKDKNGRPNLVSEFDRNGIKTLRDLYEELQDDDVYLILNPKTGRIERHARAVRILVHEVRRDVVWKEVMRSYPSGGVSKVEKESTASETCKRHETRAITTALRCLIEEMRRLWKFLDFWPTVLDLIPIPRVDPEELQALWLRGTTRKPLPAPLPLEEKEDYNEDPPHESTVYPYLVSIVRAVWYDIYLDFHRQITIGQEVFYFKDTNGAPDPNEDDPSQEKPTDKWTKIFIRPFPASPR